MKYVGFVPSGAWYVSDTNIQADLFICERALGGAVLRISYRIDIFLRSEPLYIGDRPYVFTGTDGWEIGWLLPCIGLRHV